MPAKRSSVHIMTVAFALLLVSCDRTPNPKNLAIVGELTVYTHFPANQLTTNLAVFKAKYPDIEVKVVADTSRRLAKRVLQEQHDPQADVIWGMLVPDLIRLEWHNLLSPYTPAGIERMRLSFRDTGTPPFWVGLSAWMSAFCVNTAQLKATGLPPPQGWSDLVDPIYKGRLAMPDPTRTHTGYMTVATVLQLYGETKGWKYLGRLHQNVATYAPSPAQSCQLVGTGDVSVGISFGRAGAQQKAQGAPIDVMFPIEGSGWSLEATALVKKGRIKLVAKTFLDWAISDHAMQAYRQHHALTAVATRAPLPPVFPREPTAHLFDQDFPWSAAKRDTILSEWQHRYGDKVSQHDNAPGGS